MSDLTDGFAVLQAEFQTASNRLKETRDAAEKQVLLKEMYQIVREMEMLAHDHKPQDH